MEKERKSKRTTAGLNKSLSVEYLWPQRFGVQRSSMQAVCDQEKMSKSELTLLTENPLVVLESEIPSRKTTKYSEKLSSTTGETKRSKRK
ncbi:hypothetical protein JTB14_033558 [Gonioctena quinquepunctata]|nr:hypothetical protein JTB14_033558 [Gonioctena quinquepunctata]